MARLRHSLVLFGVVAFLLLVVISAGADVEYADVGLLKRALEKPLGEKTNYGARRVIGIREQVKEGKKTLFVALNGNKKPTQASLRSSGLADTVEVLRILKSWDWPSRVQRIVVGEYITLPNRPTKEPQPVLICIISSDTVRDTDWNAFDPGKIADVATSIRFYNITE